MGPADPEGTRQALGLVEPARGRAGIQGLVRRTRDPASGRAGRFFVTPHYKGHPLVLVRPERLDLEWAKANLIRVWRAQAPKRVLKSYDARRSE